VKEPPLEEPSDGSKGNTEPLTPELSTALSMGKPKFVKVGIIYLLKNMTFFSVF